MKRAPRLCSLCGANGHDRRNCELAPFAEEPEILPTTLNREPPPPDPPGHARLTEQDQKKAIDLLLRNGTVWMWQKTGFLPDWIERIIQCGADGARVEVFSGILRTL